MIIRKYEPMNPMKQFAVFIIISLFNPYKVLSSNPCVAKKYESDNKTVCVCNSTYCDQFPQLHSLEDKEVAVFTSSQSGKRFELTKTKFESVSRTPKEAASKIKVNAQYRYQTIIGFGGAFTDSAGINLNSLSSETRDNLMRAYFDQNGLEYSLGRVPIASCDFSTREYSYDEVDGDFKLENFKLTKEDIIQKIPFIQRAQNLTNGDIKIFASPWSAPAWMKSNGRMKGGGTLKGAQDGPYYATWANYYVRFLEEYAKNGIKIWGLTVQNEPTSGSVPEWAWQTMFFNETMEKNFIQKHLGPALQKSDIGANVSLMILDDQRPLLPRWADVVLKDDEVSKYVSGIAVHWYEDYLIFPGRILTETHKRHPDKFILATEACNGFAPFNHGPRMGDWDRGENYAHDIIEDLTNWVSGWTDWNLCLDLQGGPNWADNFVDAPIIVNATADEFYKQPMFYVMGHFSKFIRPNSVRIGLSFPNNASSLEGVAFSTETHQRVLIINNRHRESQYDLIVEDASISDMTFKIRAEPKSIITIVWNKQ